jgi:CRP-like cAMP-binding protein
MAKRAVLSSSHRPAFDGAAIPNRLLAALPPEDYKRVAHELRTVPTKVKQVLHKHGESVGHVYFPNDGVCSMTTVMTDGSMVEVATIGFEGLVGINVFLGADITPGTTLVQVGDGSAARMSVAAFRREIARRGAFNDIIGRYTQALVATVMQSVACNTLHRLQQRCCRWLLMTHDRVHGDEFGLSHEFLAVMLGARRPTVTLVAGSLQKEGVIRYKHGRVRILDRGRLEDLSCECYVTIRRHFNRLHL